MGRNADGRTGNGSTNTSERSGTITSRSRSNRQDRRDQRSFRGAGIYGRDGLT
jgi:hypothetical protein